MHDLNNETEKKFSVFPNPSTGTITVDLIGNYENAMVHVHDIKGNLITIEKVTKNQFTVDIKVQEKGVYFICLIYKKKIYTQKIILE